MRSLVMMVVVFYALLLSIITAGGAEESYSRDDFPPGFVFGSGTSAYQVEGAADEDGRTPSIWDTFAQEGNAKATGDISADGYHKYKEDVKLMEETGLEAYRFSISWSRLIPEGRGNINQKGLEYYNNLINELISHGIEPHVTLCHFDLPQVLEDEYEGWLSPKVIDDFTAYADVCFREFGDRVSHWTTINEANVFASGGYDIGLMQPKRCSYPFGSCTHGDSISEPYIVAHNILLAHSSVALLYKKKYQAQQQGSIGLNILGFYFEPSTNSTRDIDATKRAKDFFIGWFIEPLVRGDYPETMRKIAATKMPKFSTNQSKQLTGSFDFIGMNYYVTVQVADNPNNIPVDQRDYMGDMSIKFIGNIYGLEPGSEPTMASYGLQGLLEQFKQGYGNPPIYIHENGYPMPKGGTLNDTKRVKHMSSHLGYLLGAIRNGSNTKGYFTWSFVDVFELFAGYKLGFGLYYVDFENNERKRYPKLSARWYSNFLKRKGNTIRNYSDNDKDSSNESPQFISAW